MLLADIKKSSFEDWICSLRFLFLPFQRVSEHQDISAKKKGCDQRNKMAEKPGTERAYDHEDKEGDDQDQAQKEPVQIVAVF